jgi:type VI secretion system secreted protein VgrG
MITRTQDTRLLSLATPLGDDVLLLTAFSGRETMSQLFSYQLQMVSGNESIAPEDIVGKNVTWAVSFVDREPRCFNGFVSRFSAAGHYPRKLRTYRAEVVPWLWFLTRTTNCRIFQNMTVPDIIRTIFDEAGFGDYTTGGVRGSHPQRQYCVQYRETAFNFVSRLMQQEGIFYFFRHDNGKHTLVLADHAGAYEDCPESPVSHSGGSLIPNHIDSWEHQYEFRSGKWAQTDYNFETPRTNLLTSADTVLPLPDATDYELFDYPGQYGVLGDGRGLAKLRMEEEEAAYDTVLGSSQCCTFNPGGKITVDKHEIESEAGKGYVITGVQHTATESSYGPGGGKPEYRNLFSCVPDSVVCRPTRLTPRPVVQGPQTAVVVGPKNEEIYTDKYARVKVQFFWDREGKRDENSSCWIRVSETWAGKNWGMICNPRIGQEVIVDFLEGDPDRPIITGRVYNAEQMPPFPLPGKQMVTGFKSNSTKGGGGYNEMTFDDSKGKEQITIHGQYDMNTTVEHDESLTVHNNRAITVDATHTETVKGDTSVTILKGQYSHDVQTGTATYHVKDDLTEHYDNNQKTTVQNNITIESLAGEILVEAAKKITLHTGRSKITMEAGGKITIDGVNIVVTGSTDIQESAPTVEISGTQKTVIGVGAQTVTCDPAQVATSGAAISATAVGVHEISGAMVKIN